MARTQARIFTSIWHNDEFLSMHSGAQRLFMLALTQETLSFCGVVGYTLKRWAKLAADTTVASIRRDVAEAARCRFVLVDEETEEIWVRTLMRHDGIFKSPNLILAMIRDLDAVHSQTLSDAIHDSIREEFPEGFRRYLTEAFPQGFPKGFPEPFCKAFEKRYGEPLGEGISTHAGAGAAFDLLPSTSASSKEPFRGEGSGAAAPPETEQARTNSRGAPWDGDPLVARWCDEVTHNHRKQHQIQAWRVISHLREHLDVGAIDEHIGRLAALDQAPASPNYLLATVTGWAAERSITIPPLARHR